MLNHEYELTITGPPIDQTILSGETVFATHFSLRNLLRIDPNRHYPDGDLIDVNFLFTVRRTINAQVFIASFPVDSALTGERLAYVLNKATLYPEDQAIKSIVDDWQVFDPQARSEMKRHDAIYAAHHVLDDFLEFGRNHYTGFMSALQAVTESDITALLFRHAQGGMTVEQAIREKGLDELLDSVGRFDDYPNIVRFAVSNGADAQKAVKKEFVDIFRQKGFFGDAPPFSTSPHYS